MICGLIVSVHSVPAGVLLNDVDCVFEKSAFRDVKSRGKLGIGESIKNHAKII